MKTLVLRLLLLGRVNAFIIQITDTPPPQRGDILTVGSGYREFFGGVPVKLRLPRKFEIKNYC